MWMGPGGRPPVAAFLQLPRLMSGHRDSLAVAPGFVGTGGHLDDMA